MTMTNNRSTAILALAAVALLHSPTSSSAFQSPAIHSTITSQQQLQHQRSSLTNAATISPLFATSTDESSSPTFSSSPTRVAVAGATGRTGKYVVRELLSRNIPVLALVRDITKAQNVLDPTNELLSIRQTDLGSREDVLSALNSGDDGGDMKCNAAIWCATGFSDAPDQSLLTKLKAIFGLATNAKGTIDAVGLPALGESLVNTPQRIMTNSDEKKDAVVDSGSGVLPKVVMLSSAGCTRPEWSEEKKLALEGCAGIPIVR